MPVAGRLHPAVDGVSFDVASGECLAIVGESGCGKTLLARALVNLPPERARVAGSVRLAGRNLLELSDADWRAVRGPEIGYVFQEPASAFDPVATVGTQIGEAVRLHRGMARRAARKAARELLSEVGFPDPDRGLDEYAHRLSGGLRQRAFLAMALAAGPKVLIADEPTTALDATVAAQVMELLQRLRRDRGLTLLLITHDLGLVARHADRALVLYAGRVAEESVTAQLFRQPRHPYTQGLLASAPRVGAAGAAASGVRFPAIAGLVPDLPDRPPLACGFAPRCPKRFAPCDASVPPLFEREGSKVSCFLYAETDTCP
ncbi:MAG TPA: ABC transporter ATP-binding protein [Thermoanaerobaculia bacterium]|nr:ABC transporter ATP-binding protein [Thermoanaerobaculia bacterium]